MGNILNNAPIVLIKSKYNYVQIMQNCYGPIGQGPTSSSLKDDKNTLPKLLHTNQNVHHKMQILWCTKHFPLISLEEDNR